ncbi:hypothetical protein BKP35_18230 [Anaerobacillus arseniciselenatis]|uniref:Uncharacterized protein n=1 Tax=Anaerobacillus arseniciselenatis TaxID=85682 RepID=A0A1S2L5K3_9BACI|nr:hypothetical protein [Anaerobacillus arseniciselenatis]OIJ07626.1 hypothetical protein BKP35_18230 [Anaerobacillus arseniciselenatis]
MFKRKKEELEETNDVLIVFDDEAKTSDIQRITDIDTESVTVVGMYKVPSRDCVVTNSSEGRNFFYRAPSQSVTETKRLAQLEKNLVLTQITKYKPPVEDTGIDFTKIGLMVLLGVAIFGFVLTSCGSGA